MVENTFPTEFVVIGKDKDSFIESYIGEDIEGTNLGDFFIILEILNKYMEGEDIGEAITETFRKAFYANPELDAYTRFEEALKAVNGLALDLERDEGLVLANVNISAGVVVGSELYLSQANDAEVYLVRKGYISDISDGVSSRGRRKESSELFENVANGHLEPGDTILFSTTRLFRYISQSEIGRLCFGKELKDSMECLEDALRTEVLGRIGIVGFKYEILEQEVANLEEAVTKKPKIPKVSFDGSGIKDGAFKVFVWLRDTVKSFFSGRPIKIDAETKKKAISFFAVAIVVFFVGSYFVFTATQSSKQMQQYQEVLDQGFAIVDSAKSEVDKERITDLLLSAEVKAKQVLEVRGLKAEATKLLEEIRNVRFTLDDVVLVSEPKLFADVGATNAGVNLIGIKKLLDSFYVYENDKLYEVISGVVKEPIDILDQGERLVSAAVFTDYESLVFLLDGGRIKEYVNGVIKNMDVDGDVKEGTQILSYGTRIYVLDSNSGQVWKYKRNRDSYAAPEASFEGSPIQNVSQIGIDGAIYTVATTGEITKYYAGELESDFSVESQPLLPLSNTTEFYVDSEVPYAFILEADQKRVLQFYKNPQSGDFEYSTQYFFETLDQIRGFTVDYPAKTIYVVDPKKIYSVEIKV